MTARQYIDQRGIWLDYPHKAKTEWEAYWQARCGWLEDRLELVFTVLTPEQIETIEQKGR